MITLNQVTKRLDGTTFDSYTIGDLDFALGEMTEEEVKGLKERLEYLEKVNEENDDITETMADGFDIEEYEDFQGQSLFDELLKLRSMF